MKTSQVWRSIALVLCAVLTPIFSYAQFEGRYEVSVQKKQEEKKSKRWTLAEWLAYKQQAEAMDLWLAKNSHSSIYESYLEAKAFNYARSFSPESGSSTQLNSYAGTFAAYAGVVGLKASYESGSQRPADWAASLNLRLLGRAIQDTHINLEYGLTGFSETSSPSAEAEIFQNQYAAATLSLYLTKNFGLDGSYRKVFPSQSNAGRSHEGESTKAGIFIDFSFLRVFGVWERDTRRTEPLSPATLQEETREGFGGGLRFFY